MPRPSSIKTLPPEQREFIEKLLRQNQHTLDEMLAIIRQKFPSADSLPSRSSLGRYGQSFAEMAGRMRDIQVASQALVAEFGEGKDDKVGAYLAQAVTTLAADAVMKASNADAEVSIKEVGELARAARAVMQARTMSMTERQAIRKAFAEEAANAVTEELRGQDGMSEELENKIRGILLGKA